jgi:multimeric flavodoxin WrbA
VVFNCTLKRSLEVSNTDGLIERSSRMMRGKGVSVEVVRAVDEDIATGVWPDMTEHGWASDEWPRLYRKVMAADILIIAGPIWLGDNSSVTKRVIERLYACSSLLNDAGQYAFYGRVGGCLITGNEDGVKHCAMTCSTASSIWATRSRPRRTPAGSVRRVPGRPTWIPIPAARRTSSPTATPPS